MLIFEKIHITECYLIKLLVNIWNHGNKLQFLRGQKPCKNFGLVYHLAINHDLS